VFDFTDVVIGVIFRFRSACKIGRVGDRWANTLITELNILYIDELRIAFSGNSSRFGGILVVFGGVSGDDER